MVDYLCSEDLLTNPGLDIETMLKEVGAVELNDPRLRPREEEGEVAQLSKIRFSGTGGKKASVEDEDSDWD